MGRPSNYRTLSIWTNGQRVGTWTFNRRGEHSLQYDSEWMSSPAGLPLSLSLPCTGDVALKGDRVRNFFDNLLPDSETIRLRIATRFKTEGAECGTVRSAASFEWRLDHALAAGRLLPGDGSCLTPQVRKRWRTWFG